MKFRDVIDVLSHKNVDAIAAKYRITADEAKELAEKIAVRVLKFCIEGKPDKCREEDGKIHMYCPGCTADITDWGDGWEFCPYCGQAVRMQKEEG